MRLGADVAVIGAGLHGCSTALHLARAGAAVTVLEKDAAGRHASGVNAGGVRVLGRDPREIPLALASLERWRGLPDIVGDDCGFRASGHVMVAESGDDLARLEGRVRDLRARGHDHERLVSGAELRGALPGVAAGLAGGLVSSCDGYADPFRTVQAFKRRARALGARFLEGTRASRIEHRSGRWRIAAGRATVDSEVLVNCAGAWGDEVAAFLGEEVPMRAVAPMMMVTVRLPRFLEPVVLGSGRPLSMKQTALGTLLIGGGRLGRADRARGLAQVELTGLAAGARTAVELFPHLRSASVVRAWAGLEGVTGDGLPVIGPSGAWPKAYHAFGFSLHGFALGPIVGEAIARLVENKEVPWSLDPFAVGRFGGDREEAAGHGCAAAEAGMSPDELGDPATARKD